MAWRSRLRSVWSCLKVPADPYQRKLNASRLGPDCVALQYVAVGLIGLFHLVRVAWREGKPGLALTSVPPILLSQAAVLLLRRWTEAYLRWRELLLGLVFLTRNRVNVNMNLRIYRQWEHHGDSPLRLLGLILISSSAQWMLLSLLMCPVVFRWGAPIAGLAAVQTLWSTDRVCARVLAAPGVGEPLARLHGILALAHTPGIFPATRLAGSLPPNPQQQCRVVIDWLTIALGGLLPLSAVACWEQRDRLKAGQEAAAALQLPPGRWQEEVRRWQGAGMPRATLGDAYLASCLLFALVSALSA